MTNFELSMSFEENRHKSWQVDAVRFQFCGRVLDLQLRDNFLEDHYEDDPESTIQQTQSLVFAWADSIHGDLETSEYWHQRTIDGLVRLAFEVAHPKEAEEPVAA